MRRKLGPGYRCVYDIGCLPPRVAGRARWVAVASTAIGTTSTAITSCRRRCAVSSSAGTARGWTAEASTVAALRSSSPVAATTTTSAAESASTAASKATNIAVSGASTAASASTSATTTAAAKASALASNGLKELRNLLVGLLEEINEVSDNTTVAAVEEGSGDTGVSGTTSTTDPMDIVVNIGREIVVDYVSHIRYVESSIMYG
jgi:hypothetical protein